MANLVKNGNFEADWSDESSHRCMFFPKTGLPYEKQVGNIFTPPNWIFWLYHDPGKYDQPEGGDAWKKDDPNRVRTGEKAYKWFTFSRNHDAGLFQQVSVGAGKRVRFTAWAHAWSNHKDDNCYRCWNCGHGVKIPSGQEYAECPFCYTGLNRSVGLVFQHPGDGKWSEGAGYKVKAWKEDDPEAKVTGYEQEDARSNFLFRVGIDPTGGTNPLADTVVWSDGYHIYNGYIRQLEIEATTEADTATMFIRSTTKHAFTHNDAYIDDAELVIVDEPPVIPPPEQPPTEDEVALTITPQEPRAGNNVVAQAVSQSILANVAFSVAFDGEDTDFPVTRMGEYGTGFFWETEFCANSEGLYSVSVTCDSCNDVLSFTALPERGKPRVQYERVYVLLPPKADKAWALAVVEATWDEHRYTVGGSADDSGVGNLNARKIICINPRAWDNNGNTIEAFFDDYYSGVEVTYVTAETPEELKAKLSDVPFELTLSYPTTHLPAVVTQGYHSTHHGLDLRSSYAVWGDKILAAYDGEVIKASDTGDGYGVTVTTKTMLGDVELLIRYAHLVKSPPVRVGETVIRGEIVGLPDNTGISSGDHLHFDVRKNGDYIDPTLLIDWPTTSPPPVTNLPHIYGTHEDSGNEAANLMQSNGIEGYIMYTEGIGANPNDTSGRNYKFDCTDYGHTAIARLNNGYGSSGTVPPEAQYGDFVTRVKNYVKASQGCNIWIIGNEQNNPREYPGNHDGIGGTPITPESYAALFNLCYAAIHEVQPDAIVMPGAVDGYNAAIGYAATEYMRRMWAAIKPADAICMHAYTHGPNKALITADTKFGDAPMIGIHYDFLNFESLRAKLPAWAWNLPIYITETNHLYLEDNPNPQPPTFGWVNAQNDWIPEMYRFVDAWNKGHSPQQIRCACLYRWPAIDPWVIHGKQNVIADFVKAMKEGYKPNG